MSDVLARIEAAASATSTVPITVPEWGLQCFIKPLSAGRHFQVMGRLQKAETAAQVIIWGLVDAEGKAILKDDAPTLAALVKSEGRLIDRVAGEIMLARFDTDEAKNS
jgi:hypothetical protein